MMLVVSFVTAFLGYVAFVSWYVWDKYDKKVELSRTVAGVLSQNFAKIIFLDDVREVDDTIAVLQSYSDIERVVLYKKNGKAVFKYDKNGKKFTVKKMPHKRYVKTEGSQLEIFETLHYKGMELGYLLMDIDIESVTTILLNDLPLLLASIIFFLFISLMLASYYSKDFTRPISKLVRFLERVDFSREKEQHIKMNGEQNEFNTLYNRVNGMLHKIKDANAQQKIASVAFEIENGMIITDAKFKVLKINRAYTEITGFTQNEIVDGLPPVLRYGVESKEFYKKIKKSLKEHRYWSGEIRNRKKDGSDFIEHLSIYAVLSDDETVTHYIFSFLDITKQKDTEKQLRYLREYDTLTGLANKELCLREIQENFSSGKDGALLCFDIRRFKEINEAYGYRVGDMMLKNISKLIRENLSNTSIIGRLENDKFTVFYAYGGVSMEDIILDIKVNSEYIISILSKPFMIEEHKIHVSTSVGVAICDKKEKNAIELLNNANTALNKAKTDDTTIVFFDKNIQKSVETHLNTYSELVGAIKNEEFELYYQPQYNSSGKPYGAEALIRWNHPQRGIVSPALFIPMAEKTGLISKIGELVVKMACKQLNVWKENPETKDILLSINIGARHFKQDDFIQKTRETIERYKAPFDRFKFELTEYTAVEEIEAVAEKMRDLKALGIKISLDDFGTGFSSLQYLKKLPIDQVKIDQAFVMGMLNSKSDIAIIRSILMLGEALNMEVIAEGVEEVEHYEILKSFGCRYFQGYYFSKPLTIENFNKLFV